MRDTRSGETSAAREACLEVGAQRERDRISRETSPAREARLEAGAQRDRDRRSRENSPVREARLEAGAQRERVRRQQESEEEHVNRLEENVARAARARGFSRPTKAQWCRKAFNYDPTIDYASHPQMSIGSMTHPCQYCGALKWPGEPPYMCCQNGKVRLPEYPAVPEDLKNLLLGYDQDSAEFLKNIRAYNSAFQMTSFGSNRVIEPGWMPTFKVQGQVYHTLGSLNPEEGNEEKYLQVYFMGDTIQQANRRSTIIPGTKMNILGPLQQMLHSHNR